MNGVTYFHMDVVASMLRQSGSPKSSTFWGGIDVALLIEVPFP
jgi:hypothetical protein